MATLSELRNLFRFGTDYTVVTPFATFQTAAFQNLLATTASNAYTDLWNLPGGGGRQHQDFEITIQGATAITAGQIIIEGGLDSAGAGQQNLDYTISTAPTAYTQGALSITSSQIVVIKVSNPMGFRFVRCRISTTFTGGSTGVRANSVTYSPRSIFPQLLRVLIQGTTASNLAQVGGSTLTAGAGAVAGGTQRVVHATGSTGATTAVTSAITATSLLAASATRLGVTIFNDSTSEVCLLFGTGTVSLTNWTIRMAPNSYIEVPPAFVALKIDAIWVTANGSARITTVI